MAGTTLVVLVVALSLVGVRDRLVSPAPDTSLVAGTDFTIASAVKPSPACSGSSVNLFPGVTRCLVYTITNPLNVAITVTSISVAMDPAFVEPSGCPSSNLDLSQAAFSGSLTVAANGSNTTTRTIKLKNTAANQNACKGVTFHFRYSGSAQYTIGTTTALASSANPVTVGQVVTYTATVTPSITPPGPVAGAVTFKDGASTITCGSGSTAFNGSTATCKVTYASTVGSPHSIVATFVPTDATSFAGSSSTSLSQAVNAIPTTSSLVSSVNPTVLGQSVTFTDSVTAGSGGVPTGSVTFYDGASSIGSTTLNASGKATLTTTTLAVGTHQITAVYAGNTVHASSTSNAVAQTVYSYCYSDKQNVTVTVTSGQNVCITSTGSVKGPVTVQSGGTLTILGGNVGNGNGSSGNQGNDKGNVVVQSGGSLVMSGGSILGTVTATSAQAVTICGGTIAGLSISGTSGAVLVGNPTSCAANTITSSATFTNNHGGLTVGGNTINGNLACTSNSPAPSNAGKPNTVSGSRTGQCAGF